MKYTITITKDEYDLILTAINAYMSGLQQKMADQAQLWITKTHNDKIIAEKTTKAAPWGLKKDGTPKKQPGRKAS